VVFGIKTKNQVWQSSIWTRASRARAKDRFFRRFGAFVAALLVCASGPSLAQESQASAEKEPEVVVRAQRPLLRSSLRDATSASTVLEEETLRAPGATSADVLSRVPGVQVARRGGPGQLATASLRGSASNQVPVYIAGIRINDDVTGTANLATVPLWMMERAEIFRGNAPEEADRLGIGGAIFFLPRMPRKNAVGASGSVGSYGQLEGWSAAEVAGTDAASLVALRRAQARNDYKFSNDRGLRFHADESLERRKNAGYADHEGWAIGRIRLGSGAHVTTVMQGLHRSQGVTGVGVFPAQKAKGETRRLLAGVAARLPCVIGSIRCVFHSSTSIVAAQLRIMDPSGELAAVRTPVLQNHGERLTQNARLQVLVDEGVRASFGVQGALENLRINGLDTVQPRAGRSSLRGSVSLRWDATSKLLFNALGAAECHTTEGISERFGRRIVQSSGACGVLEPVGRLGALYRLTPAIEILANAGRYVRLPSLGEMYGTSTLVTGNVELVPETGWSSDLGSRMSWTAKGNTEARVAVDGFLFARWVDDLIRYRRSSLNAITPFNVASARYLGLEVAAAAALFSHLRLNATLTLMDPREVTPEPSLDPTTNDVLPLTSRFVANHSVTLFTEKGFSALAQDEAALTLRYQHRASRFADSAGQTVLPSQDFVDVEGTSKFFRERVILRLSARNVLDRRTSDILGLPLPGRTYFGSLELWL